MRKAFLSFAFPLFIMALVGCNGISNNRKQDADSDTIISEVCNDSVDLTFDAEAVEKEVRKELGAIKPTGEIFLLRLTQNYTATSEPYADGETESWEMEKGTSLANNGNDVTISTTDGGYNVADYTGTEYFVPKNVVSEIRYKTSYIPSSILDKATLVFKSKEGEIVRLFKAKPQGHRIKLSGEKMSDDVYLLYHDGSGNLLNLGHGENIVQPGTYFDDGKIDDDGNLKSDLNVIECDDMSEAYYVPSEKSLLHNGVLCKLIDIVPYDEFSVLKSNLKKNKERNTSKHELSPEENARLEAAMKKYGEMRNGFEKAMKLTIQCTLTGRDATIPYMDMVAYAKAMKQMADEVYSIHKQFGEVLRLQAEEAQQNVDGMREATRDNRMQRYRY